MSVVSSLAVLRIGHFPVHPLGELLPRRRGIPLARLRIDEAAAIFRQSLP